MMNRPWEMGTLEIKNSLVRSATDEGLSTEIGAPTQRLINVLAELAKGGVGLIIAGTAYISRQGRWGNTGTGMDNNRLIKPLSLLCRQVQREGGILAAQLLHCGSTVNPAILPEKKSLLGPSGMIDPVCGLPVLELSKDHILKIVDDYAKAALRAKQAGFQAVQIHAGHGYLINQFLSASRNWRKDQYGGSLKKRSLND